MTSATPFKTKEYSSPRWALMRRRKIGQGDDVYLDRIYLIQTPWFGIMFHRIFRPDNQRDLHDHPWNFFSLVLRGNYLEDTPDGLKFRCLFNYKRAEERHSIRTVSRRPVWTLVFTGKKRRTWGFWVDGGTRFVKWTDYEKLEQA
jgi:hypothetical protein